MAELDSKRQGDQELNNHNAVAPFLLSLLAKAYI